MNIRSKTLVILMAGAFSYAPMALASECYSSGVRTGTVQKISQKGFVNKSYEGELVMEGIKSTRTGTISNVWAFSSLDGNVAKVIEDAAMEGKQVTLKYCQRNPMLPHLDIDTTYEITKAVIR